MKVKQADVDDAIRHFLETHERRPLALLLHPERTTLTAKCDSPLCYNGVSIYLDESVPLRDRAGGEILFLLGDCVNPAIRVYSADQDSPRG